MVGASRTTVWRILKDSVNFGLPAVVAAMIKKFAGVVDPGTRRSSYS
jgi:hypothetical protein